MTLKSTLLVTAAALFTALGSLPLVAEGNGQRADIPFAFRVQQQTLPAGRYDVQRAVPGGGVFQLRSEETGHSILVNAPLNETGTPAKPSLTFACYSGECVLARIAPPGSEKSYALTDKAIQRNLTHKLGVASMISVRLTSH